MACVFLLRWNEIPYSYIVCCVHVTMVFLGKIKVTKYKTKPLITSNFFTQIPAAMCGYDKSDFVYDAMKINDDITISDEIREMTLINLFKENGIVLSIF